MLLIGPGYMGREYCKVLLAQGYKPIVIGRSEKSAKQFKEDTGLNVSTDKIHDVIKSLGYVPQYAIVASLEESHAENAIELIENGVKNILIEKPGGMFISDVARIDSKATEYLANVYVAYNRRFFASTARALEIVQEDGGVRDAVFEITEWSNIIGKAVENRPESIKEEILSNNSSHVIDLFLYFCGEPKEYSYYVKSDPQLSWHKSGCIYSGAGITNRDILFSYHADWNAPGRWGLELMTEKHRLIFRPMEQLQVQDIGSVRVNRIELNDELDKIYNPGLYKQVESFLLNIDDGKKLQIGKQVEHMKIFAEMEHKGYR